jgi:hypothetical protein
MSGNLQLLAGTLARAKQENRAALITYMTAGFPTVNEGIAVIQAMLNSGADIVEVGLPHSDPVLDGPVIQAADDIALRGGVRIADVIRTVREVYQATGKPVLIMSYWNPIDKYGAERFSNELAEAGGAGCILPDLPVHRAVRDQRVYVPAAASRSRARGRSSRKAAGPGRRQTWARNWPQPARRNWTMQAPLTAAALQDPAQRPQETATPPAASATGMTPRPDDNRPVPRPRGQPSLNARIPIPRSRARPDQNPQEGTA